MTSEVTNAANLLEEEQKEEQRFLATKAEAITDRYMVYLLGKLKEKVSTLPSATDNDLQFLTFAAEGFLSGAAHAAFVSGQHLLFNKIAAQIQVLHVGGYKDLLSELEAYMSRAMTSTLMEAKLSAEPTSIREFICKEGLVFTKEGEMIDAPQADQIAYANCYRCAEHLVEQNLNKVLTIDLNTLLIISRKELS